MTSSNFDWSDVARAYSKGEQTIAQICTQFGVSKSGLYRQARREHWPKRIRNNQAAHNDFLENMFCVLSKQLEQVDQRICADGTVDAVALGNIAKTFEKLVELRDAKKEPQKRRSESGAARALREILAQNLERSNEQS